MLDRIDVRILLALDRDPRIPVLLLAQELGIARKTVQTRLARLEAGGALRASSTRLRPRELGYTVSAVVTAETEQARFDDLISALREIPEVLETAAITGEGDLICQVVARDADDLYYVGQKILAAPGVRRTRTSLIVRDLIPYRLDALLTAQELPEG